MSARTSGLTHVALGFFTGTVSGDLRTAMGFSLSRRGRGYAVKTSMRSLSPRD